MTFKTKIKTNNSTDPSPGVDQSQIQTYGGTHQGTQGRKSIG